MRPGEEIVVNINCDNLNCRKPVKEFKMKVEKNLLGLGYRGKYCKQRKYVLECRSEETCEPRSSKQVQLRVRIPDSEQILARDVHPYIVNTIKNTMFSDEKHNLLSLSPSMFGQIVHIWYEVHVFVKYDAWNDIGQGNFVKFPIILTHKLPDM